MIPTLPPTAPLAQTDGRAIAPDDITVAASAATAAGRPARWPDRHVYLKVFLFGLVLNLTGAWYLANIVQIGNADGLSRTANAWYVIFSRDPHLSAIGFVWPILPSLVQLPLLPLVRLIGTPELAGWIMSGVFGGATLAILAAILGQFGVTGWTRLAWLLLVQVHPQFWYLSASGLAEMPALFLLGLAIYCLLRASTSELAIAWIGVALVASFFAGVFVPLEAFPGTLRTLAMLSPFPATAAVPISVYLGRVQGPDRLAALGLQAVWIVVLGATAALVWRRARRRVVVQGG